MSDEVIKLSKYLGFDSYNIETDAQDPGNDDIAFLVKVAKLIPKQPEKLNDVDPRLIATYTLAAHSEASEKYSKAFLWQAMKKIRLDTTLGKLIVNSTGAATVAEKSAKASSEYELASELSGLGEAYVKFYLGMIKNFEAAHYWAKEREKMEHSENKMSGYEPHNANDKGGIDDAGEASSDIDFSK